MVTQTIATEPDLQHHRTQFETRFLAHLAGLGLSDATPCPLLGGRSNRVWRLGGIVVKLYGRGNANPLFANDPSREQAALSALYRTGMVPSPLAAGQFEGRDWLAYQHSPGVTWSSGTTRVAELLGRLHTQPVIPDLPNGISGSAEIAAQTRTILGHCRMGNDLLRIEPTRPVAPLGVHRLIHGDPVPGNIVTCDGQLTLIDWQCPQIGDPAEDVALFLSPAMQQVYRGAPLSAVEEAAFLAAYPDPQVVARYLELKPWFHWRMVAYCWWRDERDGEADSRAYRLERAALDACLAAA
ncbi:MULTISPECIES: phosphotransferase family protein [unclassified Phaeobacter]|uniref:phosphotransferase family protein n=1 Tax=unclassified Phaeobacter TaxID=2621772 RepID=UPI003A898E7C